MKIFKQVVYLLITALLPAHVLVAQEVTDSLRLPEIVVTASSSRETIPSQKLSGEELKSLNSLSVADAIRYFSGIQLKDYGGIGGLKTVDIRSMGTHHAGVFYAGIQLGNAQNGQIDLGKFSLDNIESVTLYSGQKSSVFQPAKDFGSSGSIYFRTRYPRFENGEQYNLRTILRTGSFGLINPSILWEQKISSSISSSFNTEWTRAHGKYAYNYKRVHPGTGETVYDTTAVRQNGDVDAWRVEAALHGVIAEGGWNVKSYFYTSERGIPGAIVNNVWQRSQRQWDRNFFTQGSFQKSITSKYDILLSAKYANDRMRYLNPDTTLLYIDNSFVQQEAYLSLVNKYALLKNWDISLAADFQWNHLRSDLDGFAEPTRYTALLALASAADLGKTKMQGSLLTTLVNDRAAVNNPSTSNKGVPASTSKIDKPMYSPALFASYKPFDGHDLNLRAFYKHIFRMPTFNDLYYTDIGSTHLEPEYTRQYNAGMQYGQKWPRTIVRSWNMQADAYLNRVTNKIIAVPKGNGMYRWMMMNLGQVEIKGIDLSLSAASVPVEEWLLTLKLSYTYQEAKDLTRRTNKELEKLTYGGQIAYIPWHSGSLVTGLHYGPWQLNYSFIYVGERYRASANTPENHEQPWYTSDLSLTRSFGFGKFHERGDSKRVFNKRTANKREFYNKISVEINNLFSQDYEVILNYPMPKRNYKVTWTIEM